jgi:hypothetical protein
MARSDKRYMVYPATRAIEIIGATSPALNQALECWSALLARATADNSKKFEQAEQSREIRHLMDKYWQMNEWSLLAEAIKDMRFDPEFAHPEQLIASAVEDAHRLEYIGAKCLDWGGCDSTVIQEKHIDAEVKAVIDKLRTLDYVHGWAIIVAIQWYWEHHLHGIDIEKDHWWKLPFRRQWKPKRAGKENDEGKANQLIPEKKKKTQAEKRK